MFRARNAWKDAAETEEGEENKPKPHVQKRRKKKYVKINLILLRKILSIREHLARVRRQGEEHVERDVLR